MIQSVERAKKRSRCRYNRTLKRKVIWLMYRIVKVCMTAVITHRMGDVSLVDGCRLERALLYASSRPPTLNGERRRRRRKEKHLRWFPVRYLRKYIWSWQSAWVWSSHLDSIAPWKIFHRETPPSSVSLFTSLVTCYLSYDVLTTMAEVRRLVRW